MMSKDERCRVELSKQWIDGVVKKVNAKTMQIVVGDTLHTVEYARVQKLKRPHVTRKKGADSVLTSQRRGRYRPPISVVTTRFNPYTMMGNFGRMVDDPTVGPPGVMLFNDNKTDFEFALNNPSTPQFAGGGNACVRPREAQGDAVGVCTGPFVSLEQIVTFKPPHEDERKSMKVEDVLICNFERIIEFALSRPDKTTYYYSVNPTDPAGSTRLGLAIFAGAVGDDVIDFISRNLQKLPAFVRMTRQSGMLPSKAEYRA